MDDYTAFGALFFFLVWLAAAVIGIWITVDVLRLLGLSITALQKYIGA